MKSTLLTGITVVMMTLSTATFSDKAHHKDDDAQQPASGMQQPTGMPMMDMGAMHKQMGKMQKTMKQIQSTDDAKARQDLMRQHMQEMHQGMGMMSGDMQKKMMGQMGGEHTMPGKIKGARTMMDDDEMANPKTLMKGQKMMKQRMDMMQGMMGQMMEHMMQQQKMGMEKQ